MISLKSVVHHSMRETGAWRTKGVLGKDDAEHFFSNFLLEWNPLELLDCSGNLMLSHKGLFASETEIDRKSFRYWTYLGLLKIKHPLIPV